MNIDVGATIVVRPVTRADAARIAAIYNEGIRGRQATFQTTERTAADVVAWLEAPDAAHHPFLVAHDETGDVLGWVRTSSYRSRECYAGIGEFSVYVANRAHGCGIGHVLMQAFVPACERAGLWKLVSRIFPENTASRALCARHGFREVGTYARHAKLDGAWRDVLILERLLPANLT